MAGASLGDLEQRRDRLYAELATTGDFRRGSVSQTTAAAASRIAPARNRITRPWTAISSDQHGFTMDRHPQVPRDSGDLHPILHVHDTIFGVGDGHLRSRQHRDAGPERGAPIDELLDRAVLAINRGDRNAATVLAGRVLAVDHGNIEAEDLLAASPGDRGEIRRLTILFVDIVDSTALSTHLEPEPYRLLMGRYREQVRRAVDRYGGHIASIKGDGLLAVFGHPIADENDARRAVQAGLEITRVVRGLSEHAQRRFGAGIDVRVGVHRGPVYLDIDQDDVFGMAANVAQRVCSLAPAGSVVASSAVEPLTADLFEMERRAPAVVIRCRGADHLLPGHH